MTRRAIKTVLRSDQQRLLARANQAAAAVDRHIAAIWDRLLALVATGPRSAWFTIFNAARAALQPLAAIPNMLAANLAEAARHAHAVTAENIDDHLPARQLMEDAASEAAWLAAPLFAAPTLEEIYRLVYASDWRGRLSAMTRLAAPDALAAIVANGFQQGLTPAEISRLIRPAVQGVQSSARRIARTEGMRIAHQTQMEMYEEIPGVIGYQVHSMHFPATRHWHAKRDGTIYYRHPKPGQKGFHQMPRPPLEADDPGERPAGTPHVAFSCLCWLTPVLGAEQK